MSIKFNGSGNPSKVLWKSSSSAAEQEVFAITRDGLYLWAKPYTIKGIPVLGTIQQEEVDSTREQVKANNSRPQYEQQFAIFHSDVNDSAISAAGGENATITLPDGQEVYISLTTALKWGYRQHYCSPETITNMGPNITGISLDDGDGNLEFPLLISSKTATVELSEDLGIIHLIAEARPNSSDHDVCWTGMGVEVKVSGTIMESPFGETTQGYWYFPVLVWWGEYYDNDPYRDFQYTRLGFPATLSEWSGGNVDSSTIYFWNTAHTSIHYLWTSWSSCTDSFLMLGHNYSNGWGFNYAFNLERVNNSSTFKRTNALEPTASKTAIAYGNTVYWGDYLSLFNSSNTAIQSWTIEDSMADSSGNIYINEKVLSLTDWRRLYENVYTGSAIYGGDYAALGTAIYTEKSYTSTNHKSATKSTTIQESFVDSGYSVSPSSLWSSYSLSIDFFKAGYSKSNSFTATRTYGVPSSITTPTITVTDLGSSYVNIKIVNNSSYAGSYHLSFKAYHNVGNPVSYTYSGSIGANSTAIPTINLSSYSSQGTIKGIAGTGQIYYLGKGSSAASFSRGDTGGNSGGGDVCLIKNTPILMADNTTKPIQDIVVGDEILGYDFENNCTTPSVVMYSIPTKFQQQAHYIIFDNGKTLCTTRGHELYVVEYGRYVPVEDIKEGEHCLDENGDETEVLAIHWDVELKTFEQFYHIVSSNNTYYANGILNAGVPIDKYRYIHDLRGENIPEPVEALIMDESKDTACFNFTVTNPEFLAKGTPFQSQIKKSRNRIWDLEKLIAKLDEKIAKVAAGLGLDDEYEKLKAKYYKEIAELQEKMVNWEEDYNKLLAQYSDIGEDILLEDKERRRKYFRRANKIANDNFAVYKANYMRDPAPKDLGEGVELIRAEDDYLK